MKLQTTLSSISWIVSMTVLILFLSPSCNPETKETSDDSSIHRSLEEISEITLHRLPSTETGISFNNYIDDTGHINPFTWNFIYQGAGVGVADFNGDGLTDIYFAGNFVPDKLYLNQGNLKFVDATKSAGIISPHWSTGVSIVDINADGHPDIYVCKNHPTLNKEKLKNKLFLNDGKARFTEAADQYGLGDTGFSVQATFFDIENDGDLDMYLVNQPMDALSMHLVTAQDRATVSSPDKIYISENNQFVDKTTQYKKTTSVYGLNAIAADFNDDGYTDLYISNDYDQADELLINQNGNWLNNETPESFYHVSQFSMGSDFADINHDGQMDLFTLDMSFSDHVRGKTNMESMSSEHFWDMAKKEKVLQYSSNALQVNQGKQKFRDYGQYAGVASTDWSWSSLFADLNNNMNQELIITNGIVRDIKDNDLREYIIKEHDGKVSPHNFREILSKTRSTPISNKIFQQKSEYQYKDVTGSAGFDHPGFSTGLAYADLDNDGDLDLITNNTNEEAGIYENKSSGGNYLDIKLKGPKGNSAGLGAKVTVFSDDGTQSNFMTSCRGYMSSVQAVLHFGLGNQTKIDSVIVRWNSSQYTIMESPKLNSTQLIDFAAVTDLVKTAALPSYFTQKELLSFQHKENSYNEYLTQVLLPHAQGSNGPYLLVEDFNRNGTQDILVSGSSGSPTKLFMQNNSGSFKDAYTDVLRKDVTKESLEAVLLESTNSEEKILYETTGGAEHDSRNKNLEENIYRLKDGNLVRQKTDSKNVDGQLVLKADYDNDGDEDVFVGGRSLKDKYPLAPASRFLVNENGILNDRSDDFCSDTDLGSITGGCFDDIDGDGDQDLILVGEWTPILLLENKEGRFQKSEIDIFGSSSRGIWSSVQKGDFDKDGDMDYLIGNLGENNKFHPSKDKPLYLYAGDYDNNKTNDVFLAKKYKDKIVPVRGKECSSEQLPAINDKFGTYTAFAESSLVDIIPAIKKSQHLEIYNLGSIILENKGKASFSAKKLPALMQMGPIKDFAVKDINDDGHLDFVFAGNHYDVEVETVRYDGLAGGLALGDGSLTFDVVPSHKSGLYFDHDLRDLEWIEVQGITYLLVAANNGPLSSFKLEK